MNYKKVKEGIFLSRPNRFVAHVCIEGENHTVHVKNTGRCKELLLEGVTVYLEDFSQDMRQRKTRFSLIAVEKMLKDGTVLLINMDSQAPNKVVGEALKDGSIRLPQLSPSLQLVQAEKTFGSSRFDFYVEGKKDTSKVECKGIPCRAYVEVKGVTLELDGLAKFPDAPTLRGVKHIEHLIKAREAGFCAYLVFVIQMKGMYAFTPNEETHPEFAQALKTAKKAGVHILAYGCDVTRDSMKIGLEVPVVL